MYKLLITGLLAILPVFKGHALKTGGEIVITHFNMLFAPDMSNRVSPTRYKRPLNDMEILSIITGNLYPTILRHRRTESQKDKLMVDFINKGLISQYGVSTDKLLIDFDRFGNQRERIEYIMGRSGSIKTLKRDINEMVGEFTRINDLAVKQNAGADIWSYFNQGIDEKRVLVAGQPLKYGNNTYINTYRNILILPTDGYIEAGIFGKGFDLSKNTIDRFRKVFLASGENSMQQFFNNNKQYRIKPVSNACLKNLEVLVMELYDRSLTKEGIATVHPTDMEIIKLFWTNWLQQSGVKRFELHPYAGSRDEAEKIILNFMGIARINQVLL